MSHGPGEYIDEAAMRRCAAVYALFAARITAELRRRSVTPVTKRRPTASPVAYG